VIPLAAGAVVALVAAAAGPETPDPSIAFTERIRAATQRYHERSEAITDGYRLIGRDFPAMGEHWVNIGLLFDGEYDPDHPEFLSYVVVDGAPRLLGVAYGLPLLHGEVPPALPGAGAIWHDHAGSLEEETLLPHHHGAGNTPGPRLAMVHAWVWLANPEGLYAADNWAIPFLRLGLTPSPQAPVAAGKTLSLLMGGDAYLIDAVVAAAAPSAAARLQLEAAVARVKRAAADLAAEDRGRLTPAQEVQLAESWLGMWREFDAALSPTGRERVAHLAIR